MPQISKLKKEYQIEEDGTTVVPKEILPQIAPTVLKNTVKRERTEAQKANFAKVVEANKERWAKLKAEKEASTAQAKQAVKEDHQAKVEAGTHVRVVVKEKRTADPTARKHTAKVKEVVRESERVPTLREEPEEESEEEEVVIVKKPKEKPKEKEVKPRKLPHPKWIAVHSDTDTPTETETDDTDEEEYKQGKRQIRREVKKNIRAIEKIDNVVQQTMVNPYSALLASRWK
jgi:hypothetical protein